ncbi:hypothetical protein ACSU64_23115 [Bacillaceae bacterium C204]|uniref:hypothetical protein n=1 Tax=Neobacillus sp. 204 TaxID=3383351 RepID=UPI0039784C8F
MKRFKEMHVLECLNPVDTPRALNDLKLGAILYPLCKNNDVVSFQKALKKYKETLSEILPKMMKISTSVRELKEDDLPFGFFCFEIHCR